MTTQLDKRDAGAIKPDVEDGNSKHCETVIHAPRPQRATSAEMLLGLSLDPEYDRIDMIRSPGMSQHSPVSLTSARSSFIYEDTDDDGPSFGSEFLYQDRAHIVPTPPLRVENPVVQDTVFQMGLYELSGAFFPESVIVDNLQHDRQTSYLLADRIRSIGALMDSTCIRYSASC